MSGARAPCPAGRRGKNRGECGVLRGAGVRPGSLPRPGSRGFVPRWAHFHGAFHCIFTVRIGHHDPRYAHICPNCILLLSDPRRGVRRAARPRLDVETSGIRRPPRRWPAQRAPRGCIAAQGPGGGATRPRAAHARHSRGKAADGARFQRRFLHDTPTAPRAARGAPV